MASARLVLPHTADRSPDWYAARRAGVTASEIAFVMGLPPRDWGSPFELYHRKTGELPDDDTDNDRLRLGRDLEPSTVDMWMERYPEFHVVPGGLYASVDRPWQLATPDRLLYESPLPDGGYPVAVLEIKTDASWSEEWGDDGTDVIPIQYRCQVLWQMDILGVGEARVACRFLPSGELREYVIGYDVVDVDTMRRAAVAFLDRVQRGDPPPIDSAPATTRALKRLHRTVDDRRVEISASLARRYANAVARARHTDERKAYYENRVRAELGDARVAVCGGEKVASRSVYDMTTVDRDALRRDHPDVYDAVRGVTTVNKLTPARRKREPGQPATDPGQAGRAAEAGAGEDAGGRGQQAAEPADTAGARRAAATAAAGA